MTDTEFHNNYISKRVENLKALIMKKIRHCTKCGIDIKENEPLYNYPSGVQCVPCGEKINSIVEKALNDEFLFMAKEIKAHGRLL